MVVGSLTHWSESGGGELGGHGYDLEGPPWETWGGHQELISWRSEPTGCCLTLASESISSSPWWTLT